MKVRIKTNCGGYSFDHLVENQVFEAECYNTDFLVILPEEITGDGDECKWCYFADEVEVIKDDN